MKSRILVAGPESVELWKETKWGQAKGENSHCPVSKLRSQVNCHSRHKWSGWFPTTLFYSTQKNLDQLIPECVGANGPQGYLGHGGPWSSCTAIIIPNSGQWLNSQTPNILRMGPRLTVKSVTSFPGSELWPGHPRVIPTWPPQVCDYS